MTNQKYIALIDCDSFFVSCERVLNPELCNVPVCIVSGERGCVISRSKEAKLLGVPMGIPLFQAFEKYPESIYISANHYIYTKISQEVMKILKDFSPNVEVYSIDEAFVDLTGLTRLYGQNYFELVFDLQQKILQKTGIPVSIGVSRSKTLAKLASDKSKNTRKRIALIGKTKIPGLLSHTEIQEVWGIGGKLGVKLRGFGIRTALDFVRKDEKWIKSKLGKNGLVIQAELSGKIVSPVSSETESPKSLSDTKSFLEFTSDLQFIKNQLSIHVHETCSRLRKINCKCSVIGVMLKTKDFQTYYEKIQLPFPTDFEFEISRAAFPLLEKMFISGTLYRSTGIVLEDFKSCSKEQLTIFNDNEKKEQNEKLGKSLDILERRFGRNIVRTGFVDKEIPFKQGFLTSPKDV